LAYPESLNSEVKPFKIEGIGYDFIPKTCYRSGIVDKWLKSDDKESFEYARKLIKEEGLLVGGSSGACLWGALQIAKILPADKRVVCIFADSLRNYITKFISDDWLLENKLIDQEKYDDKYIDNPIIKLFGESPKISDLELKNVSPIKQDTTIQECLEEFSNQNIEI